MIAFLLTIPIALLLFLGFSHPLRNALTQDLGRHLMTGKIILETHHVPKVNLFSYTYPNFPFINHHYLSEVIFYLLYQLGGLQILFYLTLLLTFVTFFSVYIFAYRRSTIPAVITASILYLQILFRRTDTRPELFSYLFLALFVLLLTRFKEKPSKLIYLLVPLSLLWANMHIYFFLGPLLVGMFLLATLIEQKGKLTPQIKTLFYVLLLTSFVTVINPNGISGATYPFRVLSNYGYQIEENQTVFYIFNLTHNESLVFFFLAVMTLLILLSLYHKKTKLYQWFLFLFFSLFSSFAIRNLPLFVFGTFVIFSEYLAYFFSSLQKIFSFKKIPFLPIISSLLIIFYCCIFFQNLSRSNSFPPEHGAIDGADFFLKNNIKGPLFNDFDIGSYLDYRFYPKEKVFVDGRPEAYPVSFFQNIYIPMQEDPETFTKVAQKYHINSIFFAHTDQTPWAEKFLSFIVRDTSWRAVYLDDTVIILVKNTTSNAGLIKKFGMTSDRLHESHSDPTNPQSLKQLLHFYGEINDEKKILVLLQQLVLLSPNDCQMLSLLTNIYTQTNNPLAGLYETRLQQCH